jgi:hypothetical protein
MVNQSQSKSENKTVPNRETLKSDAAELAGKAKDAGKEQSEVGKQTVASQAEKLSAVVEQTSAHLKENNLQTLAQYAGDLGSAIKNFSENLRNRTVEDLLNDTRALAKENPTAFLAGSLVVGVAVGRFFKASANRPRQYGKGADPDVTPNRQQGVGEASSGGSDVSGEPNPNPPRV